MATNRKSKNLDPLKVPNGIDASTYFTPVIPEEIKLAVPLIHSYDKNIIKLLTHKMFEYLIAQDEFSLDQNEFGSEANLDELNLIMTAIYFIIRTAIRNKVKLSIIKNDLTVMHVPVDFIEDVCKGVSRLRTKLEGAAVENRIHFPKLEKLKWRIDVAISSGVLSRVMRPNILMQLVLKDGTIRSFEVSVEQFNQLRYNVAKVLHDIQTLERHPIIKIVNEFKKREEDEYNS